MKRNIDAAADFESATKGMRSVEASQITAREIELAIPANATPAQIEQINRAIEYGWSRGVAVKVTSVK